MDSAPPKLNKFLSKLSLREKKKAKLTSLVFALAILLFLVVGTIAPLKDRLFAPAFPKPVSQAAGGIRGIAGDLWADIVIGKRDFGEISPREIVPYKLHSPGGVIVDQSVSPGRLYIWDSGNSRILGVDLAKCYGQNSPCGADIVIGQPSGFDYGACNQDASFTNYPNRKPASASTLCGVPEATHTTLEDKSFSAMFVDNQSNLWVADSFNNRVLKFNSPFTTDTIADEVWGQADFSGNGCNITGAFGGTYNMPPFTPPNPTASSLCFHAPQNDWGSGVTLDSSGNLWVADGGNNRVLRFPKNPTGAISKTANLVLGQKDFTSRGFGSSMDQMYGPQAVAFDSQGRIFIADEHNNRVLVFNPSLTNGSAASSTFGSNYNVLTNIQVDPNGRGMWTLDLGSNRGRVRLWDLNGNLVTALPDLYNDAGGSLGFDSQGDILVSNYSDYANGQDVQRFSSQIGGFQLVKNLFSPPPLYNLTTGRRLEQPAWAGVAVAANQLIVADQRLLFWNNLSSLINGKPADGAIGDFTQIPNPGFGQIKVDADNRVWVGKNTEIRVYQAPLSNNALPIKILTSPLNVVGGGQIAFAKGTDVVGLVPTTHSEFLWVSQPAKHRVFRVRNPLSSTPVVDIILGQKDLTGSSCNQGLIPAPNTGTSQNATLDMLCYPGALSMDKRGNLYVSDHYLEAEGNWRLLLFADTFPTTNTTPIFAPAATKEFPRAFGLNTQPHATFEVAFDSANRMVAGHNPYIGPPFVDFYNDPTRLNSTNPSDPAYAFPDGKFNDFYGWAVAATFDPADNLYLYDANRGQVRIYKTPFKTSGTTTVQGYKVMMPGNQPTEPAASQKVYLNGGSPISANPYSYSGISSGTQVISVDVPAGYTVGYTLCYNGTSCHNDTPTPGNTVILNAPAGGYTDLWWHYSPAANVSPTPTLAPGFSNLSAKLDATTAIFYFSYNGVSSNYHVNLSLTPDMSSGVYANFAQGSSSPIIETNPQKWSSYQCGKTLYWRIYDLEWVTSSPIQTAVVCGSNITPTPTLAPTSFPTPTPTVPPPTPTPTPVSNPSLTGNLTGTVYSSLGGTLSGVKVSLVVGGSKKTYTTNSLGVYNIYNLPAGTYSTTYRSSGTYQAQTLSVNVAAGTTTTKNVTLQKK